MTAAVMVLTAAMIAAATGGRLAGGPPDQAIDGFSIDTRTLQRGDLFFAIVAERDGHAFVGEALARGAAGVVVRSNAVPAPGASSSDGQTPIVIEVAETTLALQDLARFVR